MDSSEIRKLKCLEKITVALKEENCYLETKLTIVGQQIATTEVVVIPYEAEKKTEEPKEKVATEGEVV